MSRVLVLDAPTTAAPVPVVPSVIYLAPTGAASITVGSTEFPPDQVALLQRKLRSRPRRKPTRLLTFPFEIFNLLLKFMSSVDITCFLRVFSEGAPRFAVFVNRVPTVATEKTVKYAFAYWIDGLSISGMQVARNPFGNTAIVVVPSYHLFCKVLHPSTEIFVHGSKVSCEGCKPGKELQFFVNFNGLDATYELPCLQPANAAPQLPPAKMRQMAEGNVPLSARAVPASVLAAVLSYLDAHSLLAAESVCRAVRLISFVNDTQLWYPLYHNFWWTGCKGSVEAIGQEIQELVVTGAPPKSFHPRLAEYWNQNQRVWRPVWRTMVIQVLSSECCVKLARLLGAITWRRHFLVTINYQWR
eukprot:TRINITY_DN11824_c0_g1_i1.p1 TRINITY_DN11824_c0_g1~~TRINITY_DN11824_c0_g1_i1.p1  ORF type:complete len:372 (-),score=61.87 TRINITY_DN11824_c0_g1_i1:107-1180(-)